MKVSIIIPIYNLGNQVVKCLNSIAEQDFERSEYEIIVVLDSCTDNSEDVVRSWHSQYADINLNIFYAQCRTPGGARNVGLNMAQGEYIMFVDGDDYLINRSAITILYNTIQGHNSVRVMDHDSNGVHVKFSNRLTLWLHFFSRDLIGDDRFTDMQLNEDYEFVKRIRNKPEYEVGNKSSTYYVYLDTVAPTGTFSLENGNTIASGGSTREAFTFSATDSGSGVTKIEYKKPSSSTWSTYTAGTEIQPTAAQGMYTFRVTDKASNTATYTITVADPCANGHSYTSKVTAPTCTTGGYTTYTCSACGSSYRSNTTQALGHSYKATTITGSCTEGGYTTYTCTRCGDSYTDNSTGATGHSYSATVTAPTCTSSGYTTFTCTRCGDSYTGNRTEALGHSYQATTASSSCTSGGYTVYKCTRCGVSYTDNPTEALGHSYVASIIEATCTERGYTIYTCTKCGDSYRDNETAAKGHNYVSEVVSATCTEGGGTVYTCTRCGESYHGSETGALGHAYETNTVAATCTEGGYTIHTCTRCGSSYKDNETQPLGHNYVTTTKEATCTEYGMTVYTCQICGDSHSDVNGVYPTGHNYSNFIVKAATCTQDGERRYVCDKCGDEYTEVIPAMGHSYAITDSSSENGITTRTYTCTLCGDSYTQELGDQYEEVSSYIEELFEQYRPYMWWVLLATAGIWSIVMGVFFAIAQKNEDKEKAKKMIVNYFVGLVVIFAILVACPYLIRGIAALIT